MTTNSSTCEHLYAQAMLFLQMYLHMRHLPKCTLPCMTLFSMSVELTSCDCRSWDYWLPAYNCPLKEKIGIDPILGDNGKWLCGVRTLLQRPGCVIYSFG